MDGSESETTKTGNSIYSTIRARQRPAVPRHIIAVPIINSSGDSLGEEEAGEKQDEGGKTINCLSRLTAGPAHDSRSAALQRIDTAGSHCRRSAAVRLTATLRLSTGYSARLHCIRRYPAAHANITANYKYHYHATLHPVLFFNCCRAGAQAGVLGFFPRSGRQWVVGL